MASETSDPRAEAAELERAQEALNAKFRDFDIPDVYNDIKRTIYTREARNFVVELGVNKCQIACNLSQADFWALLRRKRPQECPIRWINIWEPSTQDPGVIEDIGRHYGFSRRLRTSMVEWDKYQPWLQSMKELEKRQAERPKPRHKMPTPSDLEQDLNARGEAQPSASGVSLSKDQIPDYLTQGYLMVQDTLNYNTVDHMADKFICIGANWLHSRPSSGSKPNNTLIPSKHWAWYALCVDKYSSGHSVVDTEHHDKRSEKYLADTVISVQEGPRYTTSDKQDAELQSMRSNTVKVLLQLSLGGGDEYSITQLASVRSHLMQTADVENKTKHYGAVSRVSTVALGGFDVSLDNVKSVELEGASNLFYYLIEDYTPIIPILIGSKKELNKIRTRVLQTAAPKDHSDTSDIVPRLYTISKELRELKHLFESYKMLIQRILGASSSAVVLGLSEYGPTATIDARLAPTARDRFERLGDRLQLLMLNSIQEYLEEQKSLSDTYFNLTNQKDSQATAKLTRSATMLAKLSTFFLPISFITSFFSIQIPDLSAGWTATTYFSVFGVTLFVSILAVGFFGKFLEAVSDGTDQLSKRTVEWLFASYVSVARRARKNKNMQEVEDNKSVSMDDKS